jgi:DNA-binding CsgD family transcriptional regulator
MTAISSAMPASASHVRIAITSPDILARIRHVFASKNLAVEIDRLPYIEITVRPAAGAGPADPSAVGNALRRLVGPASPANAEASGRLCAEYRLNVVELGGPSQADHPIHLGRRRLALVVASDDPVATLSQRQREVMALVSRGVRNADIAALLQVSEKTVKNHVNRIFNKLGAGSRVEAVLIWQRGQEKAASGTAD